MLELRATGNQVEAVKKRSSGKPLHNRNEQARIRFRGVNREVIARPITVQKAQIAIIAERPLTIENTTKPDRSQYLSGIIHML